SAAGRSAKRRIRLAKIRHAREQEPVQELGQDERVAEHEAAHDPGQEGGDEPARPVQAVGHQTFVRVGGGSSLSARFSGAASSTSCSWDIAKIRHCATLPGRYFRISVSGSSEMRLEESNT